MSEAPRHTSLEREFHAAVKLPRARWTKRLLWWLAMKLLRLRLVQKLIERRYGT